jgi:PLP dependent protein
VTPGAPTPEAVTSNLHRLRERIAAAGGDPATVTVLAVTKGFGAEAPRAALAAGLRALGENYAQELLDKARVLDGPARVLDGPARVLDGPAPEWHFIGRLQSNKVRLVADRVACWQSVDRASLVDELARRAPGARVMIQVNATGETTKGGAEPAAVPDLVARGRDAGLHVEGLMTVGVLGDEGATEAAFLRVASLADDLDLEQRSMGMTDDLAAAVRAGTTMVRVGTGLFGPRPRR